MGVCGGGREEGGGGSNRTGGESNKCETLPAAVTSENFSPRVGDDRIINVILDVGALVLEISNVNLVERWLRMCVDMKAAVNFDD